MATDFLLEWVGEAAESGRRKADVLEQFAAEVTSRPTADGELELRRRTAFARQGIAACLLMADTIPVMWDWYSTACAAEPRAKRPRDS